MKRLTFLLVLGGSPLAAQPVGTVVAVCAAHPQRITQVRLRAGGAALPLAVRDSLGVPRVADVTWSSDNPLRVAVDAHGVIWPLHAGTARITATVPVTLGVTINPFSVRVYSATQDMQSPASPSALASTECVTRALRVSP